MFSRRDELYKYAIKLLLCSKQMFSVLTHWDEGLEMWLSSKLIAMRAQGLQFSPHKKSDVAPCVINLSAGSGRQKDS